MAGQCQQALHRYPEAAASYRKAIEHSPSDIDNYTRLVELVRGGLDPTTKDKPAVEADRLMDELVARNPNVYQAYLTRARYRMQTSQPPDLTAVAQDVEHALVLAPSEADVLLAAAELAEARGEAAKGRDYLARGIELHPQDGRLYQAAARLAAQADKRSEAIEILRRGLQAAAPEGRGDLKWELANLLIDQKELAEVKQIIEELRQARANPASIDFLIGRLAIVNQQWAEAAKTLRPLRPLMEQFPRISAQIDAHLAQCYERLDDPDRQLDAWNRLAARDPGSVPASLGVAHALARLGRFDDALKQYRQIMSLPSVPSGGWTEIARLLLLRSQGQEQTNWAEVDEALAGAEKMQPDAIEVPVLRADMLLARKQPEAARALLEKTRDRRPKETKVWSALAALAEHQGRSEEALQLLREGERRAGDSVALRLAQARYWSGHPGPKATDALLKLAVAGERWGPTEQGQLIEGVAQALARAGDPGRAYHLLETLAKQADRVNDLGIHRQLFEFALQAGDGPAAQATLNDIKRIEGGQGLWGKYSEAMRLIALAQSGDTSRLHEARILLAEVAVERPNWGALDLANGQIEELRGHPDLAIAHYRDALAHGERSPAAAQELISLLFAQERYEEADREIRKLQNEAPLAPALGRLGAEVALKNHEVPRALELARQAVSPDSQQYQNHLWLGKVLAACGNNDEAGEQFRRAVAMADRAGSLGGAGSTSCRHWPLQRSRGCDRPSSFEAFT